MGKEPGKRQTTPTMSEVIKAAIEQRLCDLYTQMPGKIVSYDLNTGLATVSPLLKRKYIADEGSTQLPPITNVPVCFPRMGKSRLRFPVAAGDEGMIQWQMRSIDVWLKTGGNIDPLDPRKFNFSDATFWPGMTSQANPPVLKGDPTSLVIQNDKGFIEMTPDGKFKHTNGVEELYDLLVRAITEIVLIAKTLNTTTTNTVFGPLQLNDFPVFGSSKIRLDTIKTEMEKLKK